MALIIKDTFDQFFNEIKLNCEDPKLKEYYSIKEFFAIIEELDPVIWELSLSAGRAISKKSMAVCAVILILILSIPLLGFYLNAGLDSIPLKWTLPSTILAFILPFIVLNKTFLTKKLDVQLQNEIKSILETKMPVQWLENILKEGRLTGEQRDDIEEYIIDGNISVIAASTFCKTHL